MTKKEAIEKMLEIEALVEIADDTYMVNLVDGRLDILPSGVTFVFNGLILNISYDDIIDIYRCDNKMTVQMVGGKSAFHLDCFWRYTMDHHLIDETEWEDEMALLELEEADLMNDWEDEGEALLTDWELKGEDLLTVWED